MSERFPGIEWFCDRCNACLSNQNGFDDHRYVWKCTECGHKNSISSDDEITFIKYLGNGFFIDLISDQLLLTEVFNASFKSIGEIERSVVIKESIVAMLG